MLQRAVPGGLVQVDGDWMYREFANAGAVRSIGLDEPYVPAEWGNGVPGIEQEKIQKEKKRMEDLYFGNNDYQISSRSTG